MKLNDAWTETDAEIKKWFPNGLPEEVAMVRTAGLKELEQIKVDIESHGKHCAAMRTEDLVEGAPSLQDLKKKLIADTAIVFKRCVPDGQKSINAYKTAAKNATRNVKSGAKAKAGAAQGTPLVTSTLRGYLEADSAIESQHVARHDSIRLLNMEQVSLAKLPAELLDSLSKNSGMLAHDKWLRKQLCFKAPAQTCAMASYRPQIAKQVATLVKGKIEQLLSKVALPADHESLGSEIFQPKAWCIAEQHCQTCILPYGCTEIRVLIHGSYMVCGVVIKDVGDDDFTLGQRLALLNSESGMRKFLAAAKQEGKGFWMIHDEPNTAIVIPAGYIVAITGNHSASKTEEGASGLCWSYLDARKREPLLACKALVSDMLRTFPDLNKGDYKIWFECLDKVLCPAVSADPAADLD